MGRNYGKLLTIILIIVIILIIGILAFFAFRIFNSSVTTKKALDAVAEFDKNASIDNTQQNQTTNNAEEQTNNSDSEENNDNSSLSLDDIINQNANSTDGNTSIYQNSQNNSKDTYLNGYKVIGTISIPSINIEYPILGENNSTTLKSAIVAVYPDNPETSVNEPGNLVLWGHNYKDGTFFSNIKKLTTGEKIYIKDISGRKIAYQVYNSYETTDSDMSYARRDVNGAREITLSTCAVASGKRDIIWAREVE